MIQGDEGKAMSIMEFITDAPVDFEPYLEYALVNERGMLEHWRKKDGDDHYADTPAYPDGPTLRECVCMAIQRSIFNLEELQRKLRREKARAAGARTTDSVPELLSALKGLSRGSCFCEMGIGNPMMRTHSSQCDAARAAIAKVEG